MSYLPDSALSIPQNRSSRFVPLTLTIVLLASCSHSDAFDNAAPKVGPAGFGGDIQLTFNTDQNYWPIATEDGGGILYAFVDVSQAGGATHRCMGLMPVAGGTRAWQWCDTRAAVGDSSTSFPAFALGSDGRLLYAEATAPRLFPFEGPFVTLWLADSATPFRRRALVTLPVTLADSTVSWLADLRWTGPNTFVALGQRFVPGSCDNCIAIDSVFLGETVVQGSIDGAGATLAAVPGTVGASGYALAENGASIVFTQRDNVNLMKVPSAGGTPVVVGPVTPRTGVQLLGVSCQGAGCVVALGPAPLFLSPVVPAKGSPYELRSVSLATGATSTVLSLSNPGLSSPVYLASGDVVVQEGPGLGRLQTSNSQLNTLHLFRNLVH